MFPQAQSSNIMAKIKLVEEPADLAYQWGFRMPLEHCCFCFNRTKFWCVKDVACCQACAEQHTLADVPKKEVWCSTVRRKGLV